MNTPLASATTCSDEKPSTLSERTVTSSTSVFRNTLSLNAPRN